MRDEDLYCYNDKLDLVIDMCPKASFWPYACSVEKSATYAQCSRLYAAALQHLPANEILVTADADMCVFNKEYWDQFDNNGTINIIGADLVPENQVPMCYIAMPAVGWRHVMQIGDRFYQECLDDLLGGIEAENFRGNYWAKDQETAYKYISGVDSSIERHDHTELVYRHNRAQPGTQFATRRADRDGWSYAEDIIDAHLPRPGYEPANFHKIYDLFERMYPNKDHSWMVAYREAYINLMK